MTTNRKFENAAALRSRIALLIALAVHLALIGYIVMSHENSQSNAKKISSAPKQAQLRP